MHRLRMLMLVGASTALVVTSFAVPASAAPGKGTIAFVNGRPGVGIDICINGREVKSGLRYGKVVFRTKRTLKATVKFFKRDTRKCKGKLLGKKTIFFEDATVVVTKRKPKKVVVFDNSELAVTMDVNTTKISYGHAADIGPVRFGFDSEMVDPLFFGPSAADPFSKGDRSIWTQFTSLQTVWVTFVYKVSPAVELLPPLARYLPRQRRWEQILVGTNDANARLVFIDRPGIPA